MINSTSLKSRQDEYRRHGWTINGDIATIKTKTSTKSIQMAPDGEYDCWLKLPDKITDYYDDTIRGIVNFNDLIASGETDIKPDPAWPSAWVDYPGLARNKKIMAMAEKKVREKITEGKQLYTRDGSRFARVYL